MASENQKGAFVKKRGAGSASRSIGRLGKGAGGCAQCPFQERKGRRWAGIMKEKNLGGVLRVSSAANASTRPRNCGQLGFVTSAWVYRGGIRGVVVDRKEYE